MTSTGKVLCITTVMLVLAHLIVYVVKFNHTYMSRSVPLYIMHYKMLNYTLRVIYALYAFYGGCV